MRRMGTNPLWYFRVVLSLLGAIVLPVAGAQTERTDELAQKFLPQSTVEILRSVDPGHTCAAQMREGLDCLFELRRHLPVERISMSRINFRRRDDSRGACFTSPVR